MGHGKAAALSTTQAVAMLLACSSEEKPTLVTLPCDAPFVGKFLFFFNHGAETLLWDVNPSIVNIPRLLNAFINHLEARLCWRLASWVRASFEWVSMGERPSPIPVLNCAVEESQDGHASRWHGRAYVGRSNATPRVEKFSRGGVFGV